MKNLIAILLLLLSFADHAQSDKSSELYRIIKTKDSLLFNLGYNTCDIKQFEDLVSDNFEFYHDEAGTMLSKQAFISSIRDRLCKLPYQPVRRLNESTMKVFPLKKNGVLYGAIQEAEHNFYAKEKNKPEYLTSTARFTHLWLLENGVWKLSRSLSYNHEEPKTEDKIDESLLFKDRTVTEQWLKQKHIPALGISYIDQGKVKELTVYGKMDNGKPYPANTIFNVASLTKPVTTMVTLLLVNQGKWNLDEPVYKYWTDPDVANDPRSRLLTTRHILSHQTGFPNWRYLNDSNKLVFQFAPGTKHQYSGEGFEYLRHALENKFHKMLDQLATELIFQPLGMKDTHFFWDKGVDESRFATWHKADGSLYKTYKNTSANAADDLLTTVEDYTKFMLWVMNGAGLKKDLYHQMVSEQVRLKPRKYWGLGWYIDEHVNGQENALVHGGDDKGVHTMVFMLPESKKALLIFTNCDNGTDVYIPIIQHYLGAAGKEIVDIETK